MGLQGAPRDFLSYERSIKVAMRQFAGISAPDLDLQRPLAIIFRKPGVFFWGVS